MAKHSQAASKPAAAGARTERGPEGGAIAQAPHVSPHPSFQAFTGSDLTPQQLHSVYDGTASRIDDLRDPWFDADHFLSMLRSSIQRTDGYHGRAPHGEEKVCFAMSELKTAHDRGRHDAADMARYLKYRFEFAVYPKRRILKAFPIVLSVEPTSVCNLRCPMCFISDPRLSRNRAMNGMMPLELFRRIMDEAKSHGLNSLVLASRGEPTLNPAFPEMLEYARQSDILDIKINTNATHLTPALSRRILAAEPDLVVFSVDTAEPEVYGQIRVGAKFDDVLGNIDTFMRIRAEEFPGSRTVTRATMVITREDQRIDTSREFWLRHVDEVGVCPVFERVNIYDLPEKDVLDPCTLLWERLYIWWDGGVNPCDVDYLSKLSPGSVGEASSISSIWTGEKMHALRARHADGLKNTCGPCNRCTGY